MCVIRVCVDVCSIQTKFLGRVFGIMLTEIVQRWIDNALGNKTDGILFVIY